MPVACAANVAAWTNPSLAKLKGKYPYWTRKLSLGSLPIAAERQFQEFFESSEYTPPARLLVIRAYLDETGHEGKDYVLVCGHAGYRHQWTSFLGEWLDALGDQRLRLHMKDLRWKPTTCALLSKLGPLPSQHGLKRIIGGVKVADYEDLIVGTKVEKVLKGYIAAMSAAVIPALFATPEDERLEIVFEEQKEYEMYVGAALSAYAKLPDSRFYMRDGKPKLARWSFIPKDRTVLLDQADYLCYAMLQRCRNESSEKALCCAPILGDGTFIGKILSREEARQTVADTLRVIGRV